MPAKVIYCRRPQVRFMRVFSDMHEVLGVGEIKSLKNNSHSGRDQ